jgi:AcrR family transcriptional regulator
MPEDTTGPNAQRERRQPKQPRSQETYQTILSVAGRLFAERGYEETSTHLVAREAGISVGALYRYFGGKQPILLELYRREVSELRARLVEQISIADLVGQDFRGIVRKTLALAFQIYGERASLRRVLSEQSRRTAELAELRRSQEAELNRMVEKILTSVAGVQLPDAEAGAYLITLFIESLIDDCVLYPGAAERPDQERLIDAATDFLIRYALGRVA